MSDTTTDPAEPALAAARPSVARRVAAWLVIAGLVATGSASLAVADLTAEPVHGGSAARFVPADGTAQLVRDADGAVEVHESARGTGPGMLLQLPSLAGAPLFGRLTQDEALRAQLWRETITSPDASVPQLSTLYLLDDAGVSMLAITGGASGFAFTPAAVVLPARAVPGASWTGEGDALPQGLLRYRVAGHLEAADGGCLRATIVLDYLTPDTGESVLTVNDASTWCPGRGVVASTTVADGPPEDATAEGLDGEGPYLPGVAPATAPLVPGWADAAGWTAGELSFTVSDPAFGDSPVGMPSDGTSATTASGVLALGAAGDVVGYTRVGATATRAWTARPGGTVVGLAAIGDVVLAATTTRRLVAYDDHGLRLWSRSFPDVVLAPPVADGDGGALVVAVDGTLERIDLATGAPLWSVALRTDIDSAPAVAGGVVAVVDRGEVVHALDLATGEDRWEAQPWAAALVTGGEDAIAVLGVTGELTVLEAADGAERWTRELRGAARGIAVVDGVLVAQTDEGTAGFGLADGERMWSDPAGAGLLADPERVALLGSDALAVRTASGDELARVGIGEAGFGITRMLVPFADAVWVVTTATTGTAVGP